jgi:phosphoglycolate phosphatase
MSLDAVLFDLDGTIVNSYPGIEFCITNALLDHGFEALDDETMQTFIGPPLVQSFARFVPEHQVKDVVEAYRKHYEAEGLTNYIVYDGLVEAVHTLADAGVPLGVATLKPRRYAVPLLEHIGIADKFDFIAGTQSDHSQETKADIISIALGELGLPASPRVYMIGDREHDAFGAVETGVSFIGADWGFGSREELIAAHATSFAATPHELAPMLLPLLG